MKDSSHAFTDAELDRQLQNQPIRASRNFTREVLNRLHQTDEEPLEDQFLDELLETQPIQPHADFTANTLQRFADEQKPGNKHHLGRWWMGLGTVAAGMAAAWFWMLQPEQLMQQPSNQELNLQEMHYEELLFVEENLASAKVLIDLEDELPLLALIADSNT